MSFLNLSAPAKLREQPSPHKLAVCILIVIYQDIIKEVADFDMDELSLGRFVQFLHSQVQGTDQGHEFSLNQLLSLVQKKLEGSFGTLVGISLSRHMAEMRKSPDDLMNQLSEFDAILSDRKTSEMDRDRTVPIISRSSSLGIFLRKFSLCIQLSGFGGVSRLFDQLESYIEKYTKEVNQDHSPNTYDLTKLNLSSRQLQCDLTNKALQLEQNIGRVSYEDIENEVERLLKVDSELPLGWFVRSLNCTLHGHYQAAIDAHYKYFDYAATIGGPNVGIMNSTTKNKKQQWEMSKIQFHVAQYAVLNKARIHFQFGQLDSAATAIEETLRLAQDYSSIETITLALAWQYQVMLAQRHPKAISVLRRCLNICTHNHAQYDIEATARLNLARSLAIEPSLPRSELSLVHTSLSSYAASYSTSSSLASAAHGRGSNVLLTTRSQVWEALTWVESATPDVIAINLNSTNTAGAAAASTPSPRDFHTSPSLSRQAELMTSKSELVAAGVFNAAGHPRLMNLCSLSMLETSLSSGSATDVLVAMMNTVIFNLEHENLLSKSKTDYSLYQAGNEGILIKAVNELEKINHLFPYSYHYQNNSSIVHLTIQILLKHCLNGSIVVAWPRDDLYVMPNLTATRFQVLPLPLSRRTYILISHSIAPPAIALSASSTTFITKYLPIQCKPPLKSSSSSSSLQSSNSFNTNATPPQQAASATSALFCLESSSTSQNTDVPFQETYFDTLMSQVRFLITDKRFSAAFQLIKILQCACRDQCLHIHMGSLLVMEAMLWSIAAPQQPYARVPCIMRCLAISGGPSSFVESSRLHSLHHSHALLELADVFLKMDQPMHARHLINGILPKIMEHSPMVMRGKALLLLGKCYLKHLPKLTSKSAKERLLQRVLSTLKCAQTYLERLLGDTQGPELLVETYYLMSMTCHSLTDKGTLSYDSDRDHYASQFIKMSQIINCS